jgi:hypothetical protein
LKKEPSNWEVFPLHIYTYTHASTLLYIIGNEKKTETSRF